MRTILILLLLCGTAFAQPYLKGDCIGETTFVTINDVPYECPIVVDANDLNLLLNGLNEISVLANGIGEPFIFWIDKSENRKFEFYIFQYNKEDKKYFDKFNTSIKVEK